MRSSDHILKNVPFGLLLPHTCTTYDYLESLGDVHDVVPSILNNSFLLVQLQIHGSSPVIPNTPTGVGCQTEGASLLPVDAAAAPSSVRGVPNTRMLNAAAKHMSLAVAGEEADKILW